MIVTKERKCGNYSEVTLKLTEVCDLLVDYVALQYSPHECDCPCIGSEIIGVLGDIDSCTASIIDTLASRSNLNITLVAAVAPSTFLPVINLALPNVLDMNPLVHYIDALVKFTDYLNWTRIGLISDGSLYHEFASELFQTQLLDNADPYIRLVNKSYINRALQIIKEYETEIILLSMDETSACLILDKARKMYMQWPKYAWLYLDYNSGLVTYRASCYLEGVIILNIKHFILNATASEHSNYLDMSIFSNYSKFFYDSVMAVVLADSSNKGISNMSFTGATGLVKFRNGQRLTTISVVQVVDNSSKELFSYDSESKQLTIISNILATESGPHGSKSVVYPETESTVLLVVLGLLTFICIVFISIILFLYIYFRNEKEIKATSFTISLCMFLGCYLIFLSLLIYLVVIGFRRSQQFSKSLGHGCMLLAWFSILGLPPSLILAALFVKMLRVYTIFLNPLSYKKRLYSNYALLFYIFLIVSPNALVLLLWTSIDPFINYEIEIPTKNELLVFQICRSEHTSIWVIILVIYIISLLIAVIVIAFKTKSIRHNHFQDSNVTNIFGLIGICIIIMTTVYYCFLLINVETNYNFNLSIIFWFTGYYSFAMVCQIILFVPKVTIPFRRWLSRNNIKSKI